MYAKVNGETVIEYITYDPMPDKAAIKITGGNGDILHNNILEGYETPKVISVSDLTYGGSNVGNTLVINAQHVHNYSNADHTTNYSLVFKFKYDVKAGEEHQFHLSNENWGHPSAFIIKGTSIHLGKTPSGYYDFNDIALTAGEHVVEFGRLAILENGIFNGSYYVYLKIDDALIKDDVQELSQELVSSNNLFITGSEGNVNTITDINYAPEFYEEAVVISVCDLSYGGQKVGNSYTLTKNTTFTYTADNQHKSTIFKFKYDIKNNGSGFSSQFHFSDGWLGDDHGGIIWFRDDATRISKVGGNNQYVTSNFIPSVGEHDVEIGNLYVTAGANTGKYYIYIIVDGELICEYYQATMPEKASLFISTDDGDTIYDAFYVEPEYEEADVISVSDLMIEGYKIGNELVLDQHHTLEYAATKEHKSVIFKFLYEAYKVEGAMPSSQFHFNNSWISNAGGCIWLQNGFYITKDEKNDKGEPTYSQSAGFPSEGLYEVELGKIYVTAGENAGKYRLYIKLNGTVVNEYYVATMPNLAMLFTTGTDGNSIYDVDYVPVEVSSSLYLYKWDVARSGVEFILKVRKDFVELKGINEAGFYLVENNGTPLEVSAKLALDGEYYVAKAAIASIADEHIALNVQATAYVKNENNYNYSKAIKTSLLKELEKVTGLSEDNVQILNAVKAKVLVVSLDEDSCEVVGATKTGDFTTNTLVLTGANAAYSAYVLNGKALQNNDLVYVGYRLYVVTLGENSITLTKAEKKTVFGGSEHFVELNPGHDEDMNARTLAPMTSELGLKTVRTDLYLSNLFDVDENNQLVLNLAFKAKVDSVIKDLKENGGVENFLAVLWNIAPYEYETDPGVWESNSTPDPETQAELYLAWLELNREAAREAALLFPEIKYFEAWNEPEILVDKDGHGPMMDCHGNDYPVAKKVRILTDLMYYYNLGIKEANPVNVMVSYGSCNINASDKRFAETSQAFLEDVYKEIVNDTPVTGFETADKDPNNYFQVISVHPYLNSSVTKSNWKAWMNGLNAICEEYNDGGTEIWVTEFGFAQNRYETAQADMLTVIGYAEELDFITTFLFYKVHDYTDKIDADRWGLYNYDGTIKAIGTAVKNLINPEA